MGSPPLPFPPPRLAPGPPSSLPPAALTHSNPKAHTAASSPHTGSGAPAPAAATRCSGYGPRAPGACCCPRRSTGASASPSHRPALRGVGSGVRALGSPRHTPQPIQSPVPHPTPWRLHTHPQLLTQAALGTSPTHHTAPAYTTATCHCLPDSLTLLMWPKDHDRDLKSWGPNEGRPEAGGSPGYDDPNRCPQNWELGSSQRHWAM